MDALSPSDGDGLGEFSILSLPVDCLVHISSYFFRNSNDVLLWRLISPQFNDLLSSAQDCSIYNFCDSVHFVARPSWDSLQSSCRDLPFSNPEVLSPVRHLVVQFTSSPKGRMRARTRRRKRERRARGRGRGGGGKSRRGRGRKKRGRRRRTGRVVASKRSQDEDLREQEDDDDNEEEGETIQRASPRRRSPQKSLQPSSPSNTSNTVTDANPYLFSLLPHVPNLISLTIRLNRSIPRPPLPSSPSANYYLFPCSDGFPSPLPFAPILRALRLERCCVGKLLGVARVLRNIVVAYPNLELLDLSGEIPEAADKKGMTQRPTSILQLERLAVPSHTSLRRLNLSGHAIRWSGFTSIFRFFPQLEVLVLVDCAIEHRSDSEPIFLPSSDTRRERERDECRVVSLDVSTNDFHLSGILEVLRVCPFLEVLLVNKCAIVDLEDAWARVCPSDLPDRARLLKLVSERQPFFSHRCLRSLSISGNDQCSLEGLHSVVELPALAEIRASSCAVTDLSFRTLMFSHCETLRLIDLASNSILDFVVTGSFPSVTYLSLGKQGGGGAHYDGISFDLSQILGTFPNLTYLDLVQTSFSCGQLQENFFLRQLVLRTVVIDAEELGLLARSLPNLAILDLSSARFVYRTRRDTVERMLEESLAFQSCTHLQTLLLPHVRISTRSFVALMNFFVGLQRLDVSNGAVGRSDTPFFRRLRPHRNLLDLDLSGNQIEAESVAEIVGQCPSLKKLRVKDVTKGFAKKSQAASYYRGFGQENKIEVVS